MLMRLLGDVQNRVEVLQRAHAREVAALQAELMRLRAKTLCSRTRVFWGLAAGEDWLLTPGGQQRWVAASGELPAARAAAHEQVLTAVHGVICQTGCTGHAHPWRMPDGQCRRTGQPCDSQAGSILDALEQGLSGPV